MLADSKTATSRYRSNTDAAPSAAAARQKFSLGQATASLLTSAIRVVQQKPADIPDSKLDTEYFLNV